MPAEHANEQKTLWAPISLAIQTELIDRSRLFWGEGGQFVPNDRAAGEFNDPYNGIHHIVTTPKDTQKGHIGEALAEAQATRVGDSAAVITKAQDWFAKRGFERLPNSTRFLVPENIVSLTITDILTERVACIGRSAIVSALLPETEGAAPKPFITVGPNLILRAIDTRKPKAVEVFQGEPVHPSTVFAWSLLRNAVTIEYTPPAADFAA